MHETSLVASLLRQVTALAIQHGDSHITEIRIEIGLLAGVEPLLLSEAFLRLKGDTLAADAEMVMDCVGLTCHCRDCQGRYVTEEIRFECPICRSNEIQVTGGDAVILHSVTLANLGEAAKSR